MVLFQKKCPTCGQAYKGELYDLRRGGYGCARCAGAFEARPANHELPKTQVAKPPDLVSCPFCGGRYRQEDLINGELGVCCHSCQEKYEDGSMFS